VFLLCGDAKLNLDTAVILPANAISSLSVNALVSPVSGSYWLQTPNVASSSTDCSIN
jgi:hypothetical protein